MDNFWIKAILAVVVVVSVVVFIKDFRGPKTEKPVPKAKTIKDTWREDENRLRAEPSRNMQFRELTEEQQQGAARFYELAIAQRKIARLPRMSYKQMVDYCRQIIEKYPGSEFEYKAKRMLAEVPREQWDRYKITEQEINPAQ